MATTLDQFEPEPQPPVSQHSSTTGRGGVRATHRVALELDVEVEPHQVDPEDWDLQDLVDALRAGRARPLRTIRGRVVDPDHDRLSVTLDALAEDLDETVDLHWMTTASPHFVIASARRLRRPSLPLLDEVEQYAAATRQLAEHLRQQGL